MKKIVLAATLLFSVANFAQKDELKSLKKLYSNTSPNAKDFESFKENVAKLKDNAKTDEEKNSLLFYKSVSPVYNINSTAGGRPTPDAMVKAFEGTTLAETIKNLNEVVQFEEKTKVLNHTEDVKILTERMKPLVKQMAFGFNDQKNYKMASALFYDLYKMDPKDMGNLENAGITANLTQDYVAGEKYYRELIAANYTGEKMEYYAKSEINGKDEIFPDYQTRDKAVKIGTHGSPRNEKLPSRKAEMLRLIAELAVQNGKIEQAKTDYDKAIQLAPDDLDLLVNQANLYYKTNDLATYKTKIQEILVKDPNNAQLNYNIGFLSLSEDAKMVDEINKNTKNKAKYDELNGKRKDMFRNALPYLEKAYQGEPANKDYKEVLKSAYEILGLKDKAAGIK